MVWGVLSPMGSSRRTSESNLRLTIFLVRHDEERLLNTSGPLRLCSTNISNSSISESYRYHTEIIRICQDRLRRTMRSKVRTLRKITESVVCIRDVFTTRNPQKSRQLFRQVS